MVPGKGLIAAGAVLAAVGASDRGGAAAQEFGAGTPTPPWHVECTTLASETGPACELYAVAISQAGGRPADMVVQIGSYDASGEIVIVLVGYGVGFGEAPASIRVDDAMMLGLARSGADVRCGPRTCHIGGISATALLSAAASGRDLIVVAVDDAGGTVEFAFPLDYFADGFLEWQRRLQSPS
jgi:invasion protein IalB